jgi:hypothetical protein
MSLILRFGPQAPGTTGSGLLILPGDTHKGKLKILIPDIELLNEEVVRKG